MLRCSFLTNHSRLPSGVRSHAAEITINNSQTITKSLVKTFIIMSKFPKSGKTVENNFFLRIYQSMISPLVTCLKVITILHNLLRNDQLAHKLVIVLFTHFPHFLSTVMPIRTPSNITPRRSALMLKVQFNFIDCFRIFPCILYFT